MLPSLLKCILSPVTTLPGTRSLNSLEFKCKGKPVLLCSQCLVLLCSPGTQEQARSQLLVLRGSQGLFWPVACEPKWAHFGQWALITGVTSGWRAASFSEWILHVWNINFCCTSLRSGGYCSLLHDLGFPRLMLKTSLSLFPTLLFALKWG